MENLNLYFEQLSGQITFFGSSIVLEILIFGVFAVIYLRRQAKALARTAEIEELRNAFLIRSRRDKLASDIKIADGLVWLNEKLSRHLEYPLFLVDATFKTKSPATLVAMASNGKSVAISTESPKELTKSIARLSGANGHSGESSDLDAVASIVKGSKVFRSALIDRGTSDVFDLEVKKAGELLNVDWEASDELWFYVSASQASVDKE